MNDRTAIVGARVYSSPDEAPLDNAVILIRGDRIEKVGARGQTAVPAGYQLIDGSGMVVTAGFWNSHVHLTTPVLLQAAGANDAVLEQELERDFTKWGFTTVFDLASTTAVGTEVNNRIEGGRVKGPRVLSVGEPFYPKGATPIYARPFYKAFNLPSAEITTEAEAVQRVRRQVRAGADGVKLFTGSIVGERDIVHMEAASITAISKAAHALRKPVFAHPTDRLGLELAIRNGATILAHSAALMGPWSPEYARWIARQRVAMIPTLSLFEAQPHASTPVSVAVQQTAALHRAGGVILFGTDAGFTEIFDTSAELRLINDAIGWRGVLTSLTTAPAKTHGEGKIRGKVLPGFTADLVLLGGDPADRVENLAAVRLVIKGGRTIYRREQP
jgi:imidazolonepropionase-like amidohydrolase